MSARLASQSTTLPLPSSPHWAPITATLAICQLPAFSGRSLERNGAAVAQDMRALHSACFGLGIAMFGECRDSGKSLPAQGGAVVPTAERNEYARPDFRCRSCL